MLPCGLLAEGFAFVAVLGLVFVEVGFVGGGWVYLVDPAAEVHEAEVLGRFFVFAVSDVDSFELAFGAVELREAAGAVFYFEIWDDGR